MTRDIIGDIAASTKLSANKVEAVIDAWEAWRREQLKPPSAWGSAREAILAKYRKELAP